MLQQRSLIARCSLACLIALVGLLAVSRLTVTAAALPATLVDDRSIAITSTSAIDLRPENGTFVDTLVSLPGVQNGSASWGDCNNDGMSDVLLTGQLSTSLRIARVYHQTTFGGFTLDAVFTGVVNSATAWGDYDNDGWLDVVVAGQSISGPISYLYRNTTSSAAAACGFSATAPSFVGVRDSAVSWGDYDADGQLDLLLAGNDGSQPVTRLYRNNRGSFTDSGLILLGIENGAAVWGDYDNDGWPDLLLTGSTMDNAALTNLYHNAGHGTLVEVSTTLSALRESSAAWGDYNNDGFLDLLLEGTTVDAGYVAEVYYNDHHGTFIKDTGATGLVGNPQWSNAAWGDYDTDGNLDVLIGSSGYATVYHNEIVTGAFAAGLLIGPPLANGAAVWGHYGVDRKLDVLLAGRGLTPDPLTRIYYYPSTQSSAPPSAPRNLTTTVTGSSVRLHWDAPVGDDHTPASGLSYNLRIGTQPGGVDIMAPMAIVTSDVTMDGYRLLPAIGNVYQARAITLSNLPLGKTYYWSVQAIDTSFLGSAFATEGSFTIPYRVYLPVVLKDFVSYYASEWETEPNNNYLQSNGPLKSGQIYRGVHNDAKDYYSVYLSGSGTLNIDMSSPIAGTQLQLFYQIADVAHRVGADTVAPFSINYAGAAGWYYIYVYTDPAFVGSQTYTLTATYP
jgi:hypothetical protein